MSELQINISSTPHTTSGVYRAGSSASLVCNVEGGVPPLTYKWNSTCNGLCLITFGKTSQTIEHSALHSRDTGNHTCSVEDYAGHSGNDTIQMTVSGIANTRLSLLGRAALEHVQTVFRSTIDS